MKISKNSILQILSIIQNSIRKNWSINLLIQVEDIKNSIKKQFKKRLEEIDWMTNSTKPEALKKVH